MYIVKVNENIFRINSLKILRKKEITSLISRIEERNHLISHLRYIPKNADST